MIKWTLCIDVKTVVQTCLKETYKIFYYENDKQEMKALLGIQPAYDGKEWRFRWWRLYLLNYTS